MIQVIKGVRKENENLVPDIVKNIKETIALPCDFKVDKSATQSFKLKIKVSKTMSMLRSPNSKLQMQIQSFRDKFEVSKSDTTSQGQAVQLCNCIKVKIKQCMPNSNVSKPEPK